MRPSSGSRRIADMTTKQRLGVLTVAGRMRLEDILLGGGAWDEN